MNSDLIKEMVSPVCISAGAYPLDFKLDVSGIGAVFIKSITIDPKPGNASPRLVKIPNTSSYLNSIGLLNDGVSKFVDTTLYSIRKNIHPDTKIIVSIAGETVASYIDLAYMLSAYYPLIDAIEVNLSCPNVNEGGIHFGTDPHLVHKMIKDITSVSGSTIIAKLTSAVTDIGEIAGAAEDGGAAAITCINSVPGMYIDVQKKKPALGGITGGLSGPAILPIGILAVYKVSKAVKIPIFGCGGISSTEDALQYLMAGASAVQIGSANFSDSGAAYTIAMGIDKYIKDNNITDVKDLNIFKDN